VLETLEISGNAFRNNDLAELLGNFSNHFRKRKTGLRLPDFSSGKTVGQENFWEVQRGLAFANPRDGQVTHKLSPS
jgi:hypothetical protein